MDGHGKHELAHRARTAAETVEHYTTLEIAVDLHSCTCSYGFSGTTTKASHSGE
jgi:hypothetical protein